MFVNVMRNGFFAAAMAAGVFAWGTAAQAITLEFGADSPSSNS